MKCSELLWYCRREFFELQCQRIDIDRICACHSSRKSLIVQTLVLGRCHSLSKLPHSGVRYVHWEHDCESQECISFDDLFVLEDSFYLLSPFDSVSFLPRIRCSQWRFDFTWQPIYIFSMHLIKTECIFGYLYVTLHSICVGFSLHSL